MADALGVHVLDSLQDLLDQSRDLDLGDVLVGGDHVEELTAGGKLADQGQVWSQTQFYSVDFSKSRIGVKK